MKKLCLLAATLLSLNCFAQLTTPPNGGNKKAWVGERIGITDVAIHYDRPGVKGREGQVFGKVVPFGFTDLGFGTSKAAPWRAGANENTTIECSTDVMIEGKLLPAGRYGFFVAVDPDSCTLIFSKNSTSWGSFFYDEAEDALRVIVKPIKKPDVTEWLTYSFNNQTPNSAIVNLDWEKWRIPFKIEVDLNKTQTESFARELRSEKVFDWKPFNEAARYSLQNNYNLEQGLKWADQAISSPYLGEANFTTLSTKAAILKQMGRQGEADTLMKTALPMAGITELHNYGRQLIAEKKGREALEIFKMNYNKNPNTFTTNMGLARGYSATGDYKKSLDYAKKALAQAPDKANKDFTEKMITTLQQGTDIN